MNARKFLALALALVIILSLFPAATRAAESDFEIDDGMLRKYFGPGGDVAIPDGVQYICEDVFKYRMDIKSVFIPEGVRQIGMAAFGGCAALEQISLPSSLRQIDWYAFAECPSLTSIIIPDGVTSIGAYAFQNCTNLRDITIPNSVTEIEAWAFDGTQWLTNQGEFAIVNGILLRYQGPDGVSITSTYPGDIICPTIPNNVTQVNDCAFSQCVILKSANIPDSVKKIGQYAFYNCINLTDIIIPDSVEEIGAGMCFDCYSLKNVYIGNGIEEISERAFNNCRDLTNLVMAEGVTTIGEYAFWQCESLSRINLPESVTTIKHNAFTNCASLSSITLPGQLSFIGAFALGSCPELSRVVLTHGDTKATIDDMAFFNCPNLTDIFIPENVDAIGEHVFELLDENVQFIPNKSVTIYGSTGSFAEQYAAANGIRFCAGDMFQRNNVEKQTTYADLAKDSWYDQGVTFVTDKGLFQGVADRVFSPNTNMTRAMLMTVLARLDGQDTNGGETWYSKGMDWAVAQGISDGTMPESNVTREQLVTMLYRYAKINGAAGDLTGFVDGVNVSSYAREAMVWAVSKGIITGKDGNRLDPQGTATRAEVATIFQRFVENK